MSGGIGRPLMRLASSRRSECLPRSHVDRTDGMSRHHCIAYMEGAFKTKTWISARRQKASCIRARKCDTQIYLLMFMACVNANRLLKGLKLRSLGGSGWRGGGARCRSWPLAGPPRSSLRERSLYRL